MEILGYIPETIWIASPSFLGGCLAVFLAHHLSGRDRRYNPYGTQSLPSTAVRSAPVTEGMLVGIPFAVS